MSLEKNQPRSRRHAIEREEEKAWVSFYRRVGSDFALATEVLVQLDSDAEMKRTHLGLYLCCKESLRTYKAREARDKRIGRSVRWMCHGLFVRPVAASLQAVRKQMRLGGEIAVACLPEVKAEPGIGKAGNLARETEFVTAQTSFQKQQAGITKDADAASNTEPSATPSRKAG